MDDMGKRIKRAALLSAAAALAVLLTGCHMDESVEKLFTLPEIPLAYEGLSQQIDGLIAEGCEYAAPTSGENIQTVQMVDFDGDGAQEAVAFFRELSGEKKLKIVVFQQQD